MEPYQQPEYIIRYLYSLRIQNIVYTSEMEKLINKYYNKGLLNDELIKTLIFEITKYNDNTMLNMLAFVETLQIGNENKDDIANNILQVELDQEMIFDIYLTYARYLGEMPNG